MKDPLPPSEIVKDALFNGTDLSNIDEAAKKLNLDITVLTQLLNRQIGITQDIAIKLAKFLGTSAEMWINIQSDYEKSKHPR